MEYITLQGTEKIAAGDIDSLLKVFLVPEGKRFVAQYVSVESGVKLLPDATNMARASVSPSHVIGVLEETGSLASLGGISHAIGKSVWIPYGPGSPVNLLLTRTERHPTQDTFFSATISGLLEDV